MHPRRRRHWLSDEAVHRVRELDQFQQRLLCKRPGPRLERGPRARRPTARERARGVSALLDVPLRR